MRRTAVFVTALAAAAVVLSACASEPGGSPPAPSRSAMSEPVDDGPIGLVGLWRVADAEGEGSDVWLRLDAGEFQLWRDCGMIMGSWRAGRELIAASTY